MKLAVNLLIRNELCKLFFITPLLKTRFSVAVERVGNLKVGLQIAVSNRSKVTSNKILKRVAMKNKMHYSKQNIVDVIHVTAALASLG